MIQRSPRNETQPAVAGALARARKFAATVIVGGLAIGVGAADTTADELPAGTPPHYLVTPYAHRLPLDPAPAVVTDRGFGPDHALPPRPATVSQRAVPTDMVGNLTRSEITRSNRDAHRRPRRAPAVLARRPRRAPPIISETDWPLDPFTQSMQQSLFRVAAAAAHHPVIGQDLIDGVPQSDSGVSDSIDSVSQDQPIWWDDFSATPIPQASLEHRPDQEWAVYAGSGPTPTQSPWIEWGRPFYGSGITPKGINWMGDQNLVRPEFYLYGDYRTAIISGRNAVGRTDNWASRLNLDADLRISSTERFHAFVGPLDQDGRFSRWERVAGDLRYRSEIDFTPATAFFEGDLGSMIGGARGHSSKFDLPFTIGLVPLLYQNGIWMEDAVTGAAFALPARHSRLLNWSNYDATFFAVFDQLNSPAFGTDENAAQAFGTAWFIEAYGGYIESGYAFVRDRNVDALSYHNATISFTRRYFDRISNSVRVIVNAGQDLPDQDRTADGVLLLFENSWITDDPLRFVPYANFFVGFDRPQSVARAGVSGGILRNTGINFDTDGLNGFATLDPTGSDTAGGSIGVDLIGQQLDRQWLVEATYLTPHGSKNPRVPDDQFGLGTRYQFPISHRTLIRMDALYGWRRGIEDVYGTRIEYRWKF